ncbi:MAG: carbohydrate ABC transporter permease [Actinomycetota bacterium]|nr:carbohydrate ABC transporter permease [Actinomycetota bacterium]
MPVDRRPLRRRQRDRALMYALAIAFTAFMAVPLYLIALAAFSQRDALAQFPLPLLPTAVGTDTLASFLGSTGIVDAFINSLIVGIGTLILAIALGAPAGYALARYTFRGRDAYQLSILFTRSLPIVILAVPLAVTFTNLGLYDALLGIIFVHTVLAMPTTALITASIFVSVPKDVEEAALVLGCTPFGAVRRVVLPLALPGIAASSIFTFVLSWNEVFAATILSLSNRTLPAQVLASLQDSPLYYRFAGGFALVVPSMIFILFMRRYLLNMWGSVVK